MAFESINQQAQEYPTRTFQRLSEISAGQLRDCDIDLRVPFQRTACDQKCFSYRGAKLWNDQNTETKRD